MRVLQVDSGRKWRGGQNQAWVLSRELSRVTGLEQILVTRQGSELARRVSEDGVTVRGTAWEIGLDPRAWWHLRRTIAAFQPDVIHVHDSHALTLAATVALGRTLVATRRVDFHVGRDRKSTRLNSSHLGISYAVFCLKKKKTTKTKKTNKLDNTKYFTDVLSHLKWTGNVYGQQYKSISCKWAVACNQVHLDANNIHLS